ncbi:MAG: CHASE domain-containing protein [Bauldia sp.]|nr:CHASE domain-containing protein [Bauldia sp.]
MTRGLLSRRWFAPLVAFVVVLAIVAAATGLINYFARQSDALRFESYVEDVSARIQRQVDQHLALLEGAAALFHVFDAVPSRQQFEEYVARLDLPHRYPGLAAIGFAERVDPGDPLPAAAARMGDAFAIRPPPGADTAYPIVLLQPTNEGNTSAMGFDVFSEAGRREAMERARDTGLMAATGRTPSVLQGDGARFQIYFPYYGGGYAGAASEAARRAAIQGFIFASFQAEQFFSEATSLSPLFNVAVAIYDEEVGPSRLFYVSDRVALQPREAPFQASRSIGFAGKRWALEFASMPEFAGSSSAGLVAAVAVLGLLLAGAAAGIVWQQVGAWQFLEREAEATRRSEKEKDLLLNEMNHRLKNSLARVQAIGRQTARGSSSIDEFLGNFNGRLEAMSATQDLLTRSRRNEAPLRDLLKTELTPVLGEEGTSFRLEGPRVVLDPKQVLALGLTFHELATNAMKHGSVAEPGGFLEVTWSILGEGDAANLVIEWSEKGSTAGAVPTTPGFGSALVEATVVQELGGKVDRQFQPDGLRCRIAIPWTASSA